MASFKFTSINPCDLKTDIAAVDTRIARMKDYLKLRTDMNDWHGIMDAAADLRELEVQRDFLLSLNNHMDQPRK